MINRNLFTEKRDLSDRFGREPKWVPWVGGFVMGWVIALLTCWGI